MPGHSSFYVSFLPSPACFCGYISCFCSFLPSFADLSRYIPPFHLLLPFPHQRQNTLREFYPPISSRQMQLYKHTYFPCCHNKKFGKGQRLTERFLCRSFIATSFPIYPIHHSLYSNQLFLIYINHSL